jgi:hypothetical protein
MPPNSAMQAMTGQWIEAMAASASVEMRPMNHVSVRFSTD